MKLRKTQLSATSAIVLLSGMLAACGNDGNNEASPQATTPASGTPSQAASENADPLGKYEETVTVTQVLGYNAPEDSSTPQGMTPPNNAYLKDLKDMLNIELKYLWTVPRDQYEQKFSVSLASGDLPDVLQFEKAQMFEKLKKQGVLADLTEAYEKYASPTLKAFMESDGGIALKAVSEDGKLYALPGFEDPFLSTQLLWIRKDWLDNLGLQAPTTIDELEKVAEAFVNEDPDKNGQNDTYGVAMQKTLIGWGFDARGFFNGFDAYPGGWIKDESGNLAAGEIQPATKEALARMQSWYQKGIFNKEFGFKDENKVTEDIVAGKVGITYGEWWMPNWPLNLNKDNQPEAEWIGLPIPSADGASGKSLVPSLRLSNIVAVNKEFDHPEAVVKMANFYIEMNTKKYAEQNKASNGYVYNWFVPGIYNPSDIDTIYTEVNKAIANKETTITDESLPYYKNIQDTLDGTTKFLNGDKSGWGLYYSRVAEDGGWGLTRQIRDSKNYVLNEYYGPSTKTQTEKGSQLDKLLNETFIKIIMGSASVDEFDNYVKSWKALGGDSITKEINEWYASNK